MRPPRQAAGAPPRPQVPRSSQSRHGAVGHTTPHQAISQSAHRSSPDTFSSSRCKCCFRKVLNVRGGPTSRRPNQVPTLRPLRRPPDPNLRRPVSRRSSGLFLLPRVGLAHADHRPPAGPPPLHHSPQARGASAPPLALLVPTATRTHLKGPRPCAPSIGTATGQRRAHSSRPLPLALAGARPSAALTAASNSGRRRISSAVGTNFQGPRPGTLSSVTGLLRPHLPLGLQALADFSIAVLPVPPGSWTHHSSAPSAVRTHFQGPQPGAPSPIFTSGLYRAHPSHASSPGLQALAGTIRPSAHSAARFLDSPHLLFQYPRAYIPLRRCGSRTGYVGNLVCSGSELRYMSAILAGAWERPPQNSLKMPDRAMTLQENDSQVANQYKQ
ncbi:hypothetical protein NDU88_002173 [Pleurodeles waltl]|uniref:Uncharacterized protein n=1 Tax=Pleurodeles waltl TaxID=8319 RepID=A0AAV7MQM5_PLEWA|nr:hypothetical protein NDU88_002173 [Pleurodeles waltl]